MTKQYYVYILTNKQNRVLYAGVTSNLEKRLYEHRNDITPGFASKYKCHKLVYFEVIESVEAAIAREKQIKAWSRRKKIYLINGVNPKWLDLSLGWG